MPLENSNTIAGLNPTWPLGSDPKSQGDDHLRLIKDVLQKDAAALSGANQAALIGAANVFTEEQTAPRWRASAGGAALPGFAFLGDGSWNTGIWESGSNVMGFGILGNQVASLNNFRWRLYDSITNVQFDRSDAQVNFDFPNRPSDENGLLAAFRASGNTTRYTMRGDGSASSGTDVVTVGNGNDRYAQLGAANTFGELATFENGVRANFGSAATPSYAFDGDINTGMFIVEQNVLGISVNGQLRYRFDFSGFDQDEDVVTKARADANYARLTEANVFSGASADQFEGADSVRQIKLKNTSESDPAFLGQKAGMGIRMITGSATGQGTVYDCDQAGSETSNTMTRRIYADGRYQQSSSDAAKKENITPLGDVGDMIDALQPCEYTWKADELDPQPEGVQIGAIAQEVEAVLPSAVRGEDGNKAIDLRPVVWALVKEVQLLRQRVAVVEA